jgi:hypothetical protein
MLSTILIMNIKNKARHVDMTYKSMHAWSGA